MKKFLSLLTVVAILFTVSVMPAFAADGYSAVYKVEGDEGNVGDVITVELTVKGASEVYALQGYLTFDHDVITPVQSDGVTPITYKADGTATKTNIKKVLESSLLDKTHDSGDYEGEKAWGVETVSATNAGTFGMALCVENSDSDSTPLAVSSEGLVVYKVRFVRNTTGDINLKLDTTMATKIETSNASGNVLDAANVTIDYTAPGGSEPDPEPADPVYTAGKDEVDAYIATLDPSASWVSGFKYKVAKDSDATSNEYAGKKVVAFGKNGGTEILPKYEYGIRIGTRFYPGIEPVAPGQFFSIIIMDAAGKLDILDSYKYQVYLGNAEVVGEENVVFQGEELNAFVQAQ